jgi:hypothetical protein
MPPLTHRRPLVRFAARPLPPTAPTPNLTHQRVTQGRARRRQPSQPRPASSRPGKPAPTIGLGTGAVILAVPISTFPTPIATPSDDPILMRYDMFVPSTGNGANSGHPRQKLLLKRPKKSLVPKEKLPSPLKSKKVRSLSPSRQNLEHPWIEAGRRHCTSSEHFGQLAWQFKRMSGSSGLKVQAAIAC